MIYYVKKNGRYLYTFFKPLTAWYVAQQIGGVVETFSF